MTLAVDRRSAALLVMDFMLGISTSGVVLSTLRHAADLDLDFEIILVKDGCADPDDEVHRVLTEKVFVRQSTVATCRDVGLGPHRRSRSRASHRRLSGCYSQRLSLPM